MSGLAGLVDVILAQEAPRRLHERRLELAILEGVGLLRCPSLGPHLGVEDHPPVRGQHAMELNGGAQLSANWAPHAVGGSSKLHILQQR